MEMKNSMERLKDKVKKSRNKKKSRKQTRQGIKGKIIRKLLFSYYALTGVAQWIEYRPMNQRVASSNPVIVHAWVASQVPTRGARKRQPHTDNSLPLSYPSPFSKNK